MNMFQCTPKELADLLRAFERIGNAYEGFERPSDVGLESSVLNEIIHSLPRLQPAVQDLLSVVNLDHASENRKDLMWEDPDKYPGIVDAALVHTYLNFCWAALMNG